MNRSYRTAGKTVALVAAVAVTAGLLAACSNTGGAKAAASSSGISAGQADTPHLTFAMITHATAGDTFWDIVRKGAEAAAAKDNVTLKYSSDPDASKQAALITNAIDSKVDGIALTLANPDAIIPAAKQAEAAGIPVTALNSGENSWQTAGAIGYFGSDETVAGQALGNRLNALGAKHDLCVIQEQGNIALQERCDGVKSAFKGTTDTIYVNGEDTSAVLSTLEAKLKTDSGVDQVTTLGAPVALTALQAVSAAGSSAKVNTFDLSKDVAADIKAGTIEFAVDQQPFLEGYLAIDALWLYKVNGDAVGGGKPTLTGPAFVDSSNIATVYQYAVNGTR